MGLRLRCNLKGEVGRKKEEDVSRDGRGLCSRLESRLGGGVVLVLDPEGSPDRVLLWPMVDCLPERTDPSVEKSRPSSGTIVSKRLLRDSRLSRDVCGGCG